jgi:hypothetical protein
MSDADTLADALTNAVADALEEEAEAINARQRVLEAGNSLLLAQVERMRIRQTSSAVKAPEPRRLPRRPW